MDRRVGSARWIWGRRQVASASGRGMLAVLKSYGKAEDRRLFEALVWLEQRSACRDEKVRPAVRGPGHHQQSGQPRRNDRKKRTNAQSLRGSERSDAGRHQRGGGRGVDVEAGVDPSERPGGGGADQPAVCARDPHGRALGIPSSELNDDLARVGPAVKTRSPGARDELAGPGVGLGGRWEDGRGPKGGEARLICGS